MYGIVSNKEPKIYDEDELDILIARCDSILTDSISPFKSNF